MVVVPDAPPQPDPPNPARVRGRQHWVTGRRVFIAVTLGILIYLVMGPLLVLFVASFQDTVLGLDVRPPVTWTLENYVEAFITSSFTGVITTTLVFTIGSLLFAFAFSFALYNADRAY